MSDQKAYCDIQREVGMEGDSPLTVRPCPDFPLECVQLLANGAAAEQYWGSIRLSMPKQMAVELGKALIACAGELG